MRIIGRDEWGAAYGDGRYWTDLPATELWLHHSVTLAPDLVPPWRDDYEAIRHIDRIGYERFGWVYGFPYTFGITPAGLIFGGHHIAKTGAHTKGHNTAGRAIVLVGNYEDDEPTEAMLDSVAWLVRHGHERGWWDEPALTGGHRDVKATACPGIHAYRLIDEINRRAAAEEDIMAALSDDEQRELLTKVREIHTQERRPYDYRWHHDATEDNQYGHTLAIRHEMHGRLDAIEAKLDDGGQEADPAT